MTDEGRGQAPGAQVFCETARMVLRRFTMADVDLVVSLDSDPEVMRFITGGAPTSRAEATEHVASWLTWYDRSAAYGFFVAIERTTGESLGWFHFRPGEGAGPLEPEIGYRLRRAAWGRGLATEGSRALVELAFTDLEAERVYATTMAVNLASRRVMEKAGLRYVRTFDADWPVSIAGDEDGDVEYGLTRAEWAAGRAADPAQ